LNKASYLGEKYKYFIDMLASDENTNSDEVISIICIPGTWDSWEDFTQSISTATNGVYSFEGDILINSMDERCYAIEFFEAQEDLDESFRYAGMVTGVSEHFLEEVGNQSHVIFISSVTGNMEEAWHLALAAKAILDAGGIGIRIETAGKAFEKEYWNELIENFKPLNLYLMFVVDTILDEDGSVYTCGMHNIGYKDIILSGEKFEEAATLIYNFAYYQVHNNTTIQNGGVFSTGLSSPKFRISDEPNQPYQGDEMFENDFGMWRLSRL